MNKYCLLLLVTIVLGAVSMPFASHALAQTPANTGSLSSGIGLTVTVTDKNAPDGSIVSFSNSGYHLSTYPYDPTIYGVISDNASVTLEDPDTKNENSHVLLTSGKTTVRVSTINGPIKAGNLITTSVKPGVGQLATEDGYVLGVALEDYTEKDPNKIGSIFASLNFGFNSNSTVLHKNLINNIKSSINSPFITPVNTFRYIVAGLAVLLGLLVGLIHFGRSTSNGIEALGRNPLARNAILLSMGVNLLLTIAAMALGLAIAYLILSL